MRDNLNDLRKNYSMNQYMAELDLPDPLPDEFVSLIPSQRARVNELMNLGRIAGYTLAMDRSKLWTVIVADSETEALELVSTFPLFKFMAVSIRELAFHQSPSLMIPHFSLN
jgi:muconolactone delta-isomerase